MDMGHNVEQSNDNRSLHEEKNSAMMHRSLWTEIREDEIYVSENQVKCNRGC